MRRCSWWRGPLRIPLTLLVVLGLAAVAVAWRPAAPDWSQTFDSPEALARAALDAMARSDRQALAAMAISEAEFRARVWPELPASRPERNVPLSYVWSDLDQKSRLHLAQTFAAHAGRQYELVSVRFHGETTRYGRFVVARKPELVVRDEEGVERPLRLFGSVLIDGPRHKLFSYVTD